MRRNAYLFTPESLGYLYHVTERHNLPSIASKGLTPSQEPYSEDANTYLTEAGGLLQWLQYVRHRSDVFSDGRVAVFRTPVISEKELDKCGTRDTMVCLLANWRNYFPEAVPDRDLPTILRPGEEYVDFLRRYNREKPEWDRKRRELRNQFADVAKAWRTKHPIPVNELELWDGEGWVPLSHWRKVMDMPSSNLVELLRSVQKPGLKVDPMTLEVETKTAVYRNAIYRFAGTAEKEMERLFLRILPGTEFAGEAFAVGGYVRDEVLGKDSKDLDVVVGFPNGAETLAKFIKNLFPSEVSTPYQMGAYPIWHLAFRGDIEVDGDVFHTEGGELDIADSQRESFPDAESRQRDVEFGTIEEDVERRDFTVNMLLKDLATGELVDLSGTSVADIEEGILRTHPNVPPDQPFKEDPLRMMRLVRFMAKYGWKAAPETVEAVRRNAHRIDIVSGERVRDELIKIMKLGRLEMAIRFMADTGLLKHIMPEIDKLRGVEQPPEYHSEGDVFEHTMHVLKNSKPTVDAQLAALLHDTGKPATQEFYENRIRFLGHEEVSGEIAEAFLRRLRFDLGTIKKVTTLVRNHMRPHSADKWKPTTVRKFMRELGEYLEDVLDLVEADALGSLGPSGTPFKPGPGALRERIRKFQEMPVSVSAKPPLSGRDVMRILEVSSGPEVGKALRWLQERMDEMAVEGKEMSPEDAEYLLLKDYAPTYRV